jgi:hypothetical protein
MLSHTLRRTLVIGATVVALALPGVAAAATDIDHSNHRYNQPEETSERDGAAKRRGPTLVAFSGLSIEECQYFELNIPAYDCQLTLAQWAAVDDPATPSGPPPGVDYTFWEENYWEFADGRATFAWISTTSGPFIDEEDDFPLLEDAHLAY